MLRVSASDDYELYSEELPQEQKTRPQVIGCPASRREIAASASASMLPAPHLCRRLPVLLLAVTAAGACVAAGVHFHGADSSAELRREVQKLKEQNQVLAQRANLAQQEQQDLARIILDPRSRQRLTNMMERSQAFDELTRTNGFLSSVENTVSVRKCLGQLLSELNVTSVLDVPCGDGSWQHLIPGVRNVTYVGADINLNALEQAKHRHENIESGMDFMLFDAVHFPLKRAFDLVLYRDTVEQQRVQDSLTAVLNFKMSGSRYLAATYWPGSSEEVNKAAHNLEHADWYEANLLAPPFAFPKPLASCENADAGTRHAGKSRLGIWRLQDLPVTAAALNRAQPQRHPVLRQQEQVSAPEGLRQGSQQYRSTGRVGQPKRQMTLDELLDAFGSAFAPQRQRRPFQVDTQEEHNPFDGLFSDWLETAGPVQGGLPRSRGSSLPTQFFDLPRFRPLTHGLRR